MGCLLDLVKLTIVVFAIIGFVSVGGLDLIKEHTDIAEKNPELNKFVENVKVDKLKFKDTKTNADFSKISKKKYKIEFQGGLWGVKSILASERDSSQSMIYLNTEGVLKVTKEEFSSYKDREAVDLLVRIFKYQRMTFSNYKISRKSNLNVLGQNAPCYEFSAEMKDGPFEKIHGMFSMIQEPDGQNVLLLSYNFDSDFEKSIAQDFYNQIKYEAQ